MATGGLIEALSDNRPQVKEYFKKNPLVAGALGGTSDALLGYGFTGFGGIGGDVLKAKVSNYGRASYVNEVEGTSNAKTPINPNPFKGKTPVEIDKMLREAGFEPRGPDPLNGKGGYVNPKTGRSYHIDEANSYGEPPHVDVNRPRDYKGPLDKKKYDMK